MIVVAWKSVVVWTPCVDEDKEARAFKGQIFVPRRGAADDAGHVSRLYGRLFWEALNFIWELELKACSCHNDCYNVFSKD